MNQKKLLTLRSVGLMFIVRKWPAIKQAIRRTRQGFQSLPRAWMRGNGVRSFWGERNFGDLMTPPIAREPRVYTNQLPNPKCDRSSFGREYS